MRDGSVHNLTTDYVEDTVKGIYVDVPDGTTEVRINDSWLSGNGIDYPLAHTEDGSVVEATTTVDGSAVALDTRGYSGVVVVDPTLDDGWQREGFKWFYDASGPVGAFDFNVSVSDVSGENITFKFWKTANGTDTVFDQETFHNVTREGKNRSEGYHSFNFINETNVDNLTAELGRKDYNLTSVTSADWVFTRDGSNLTYFFDRDQGWLRKVTDSGNGAEIVATATASSQTVPPGGPTDPGRTAQLTREGDAWTHRTRWDNTTNTASFQVFANWNGGTADETVAGNLFSTSQSITVKADLIVRAQVKEACSDTVTCDSTNIDTCFDTDDCYLRSIIHGQSRFDDDRDNGWVVDFDDGLTGKIEDVVAHCTSRNNCPFSTVTLEFTSSSGGSLELSGTIEQPSLLAEGNVPFWACAIGKVWLDGKRPPDTPDFANPECSTPNGSRSDETGFVRVNSFEGLP